MLSKMAPTRIDERPRDVRDEIGSGLWDESTRFEDLSEEEVWDKIALLRDENDELRRVVAILPAVKQWADDLEHRALALRNEVYI